MADPARHHNFRGDNAYGPCELCGKPLNNDLHTAGINQDTKKGTFGVNPPSKDRRNPEMRDRRQGGYGVPRFLNRRSGRGRRGEDLTR